MGLGTNPASGRFDLVMSQQAPTRPGAEGPPQMQKHAAGGLCALPPAATIMTLSKAQVQSSRVGTRPRGSAECGTFPQTWTPHSPACSAAKGKGGHSLRESLPW